MSPTLVVTRLAVRELWISFRLLVILAAYVAAGTVVALLPATLAEMLGRLALGVAAAVVVGAATAAWSLSRERALGRVGWLAMRSISRGTILVGWFVALGLVSILGVAAAGVLGWLAVSTPIVRLDPTAFGATFGAIACAGLAMLALGLVLGAVLRPAVAAAASVVVSAALIAIPWLVVARIAMPVEALAQLTELDRPLAVAAQGAGAGLTLAGAFLLVARLALDRVDL